MDSFSFLVFVLSNATFCFLSPLELARLKMVSRSVRREVLSYEAVAFSLRGLYGPFFGSLSSISLFRQLQLGTGALVLGSALVQFLSRSSFTPSDLDVFVAKDGIISIGTFLAASGYRFVPLSSVKEGNVVRSEAQPPDFRQAVRNEFFKSRPNTGDFADRYEYSGIAGVFSFTNDDGMKVQIVAAERQPIEVILGFYSTLVLNVATATEAVSFYPRSSFVERRALYLKRSTAAVEKARQKYEGRGWASVDTLSAQEYLALGSEFSHIPRFWQDSFCWTTKFPEVECVGARQVDVALRVPFDCDSAFEVERALPRPEFDLYSCEDAAVHSTGQESVDSLFDEGAVQCDSCGGEVSDGECSTVSSSQYVIPRSLDAVVQDYLGGLLPLLVEEYGRGRLLKLLRNAFATVSWDFVGQGFLAQRPVAFCPSAFVASAIIQCTEDVAWSILCDEDDIECEVTFVVDSISGDVWTVCTIYVSAEQFGSVWKDVADWVVFSEEWEEVKLRVRLCGQDVADVDL
ncbi:hypothetical protein VNI00_013442 [Paramarasmius palmivorus]|uniref:Uncharacterized protein n=1 Tax=Paramarasmius palmivorus TaxID=297713 RepID=A0AAW0C3B4_9AGAR